MKTYAVRFRGTAKETMIEAYSARQAKIAFAKIEGIAGLGYIQARVVA